MLPGFPAVFPCRRAIRRPWQTKPAEPLFPSPAIVNVTPSASGNEQSLPGRDGLIESLVKIVVRNGTPWQPTGGFKVCRAR